MCARRLNASRHLNSVLDRVAACLAIGHRIFDDHCQLFADCVQHPAEHFVGEPGAVLDRAAIAVPALVVELRDELAEQITMPHVEFDRIETGFAGVFGSGDEFHDHRIHIGAAHLLLEPAIGHDPDLVEPATGR